MLSFCLYTVHFLFIFHNKGVALFTFIVVNHHFGRRFINHKFVDRMRETLFHWDVLVTFTVGAAAAWQGREAEATCRLDLAWRWAALQELQATRITRQNNAHLLRNILPQHVVGHFLSDARKEVCIPLFDVYYSENQT